MTTWVYDFTEGSREMLDLLGGKGANLAEMTRLGLPVPPGFTITTQACRAYLTDGDLPPGLALQMAEHLAALERAVGKRLGDPDDPLLVSVRSGARFSMPGMMDTVLDVGLNDESVIGLADQAGSERFAWDSYRRLLQMFGRTVLGAPGEAFEQVLDQAKRRRGTRSDLDLDARALRTITTEFKTIIEQATGTPFPQDPQVQLELATRAVFDSWNGERARLYRRQERIPPDLGTAVNICAMVFGNLGLDSGTGVAFTRDPSSGAPGVYGDYLQNAQGEDVVAGVRNTVPLAELEALDSTSYRQLRAAMATLEAHYRDLCDIEFTVERGRLWLLQTRVGKRTAGAAFRIATQLVDQGLITLDEALQRVTGAQLARLMFPAFGPLDDTTHTLLGTGTGASPGAAVGRVVFDSPTAVAWAARGEKVVLVRRETTPDDLSGMIAAQGVLTIRGGRTSHAAVVARGMGKTCVCGAEELHADLEQLTLTALDGTVVREGDVLSLDGTSGAVYLGAVPVRPSPVARYFEGGLAPASGDDLVRAVDRLIRHADHVRRLAVRANADTAKDAARARAYGASGIGLCRTEHMFLGDRRQLVEDLILADSTAERQAALAALLPLQREDFRAILRAMDTLPVTVRLLDPPLHEFLPDYTELSVELAVADATVQPVDSRRRALLDAVRRLHESNPMIGLRGVRLGLVIPGLFAMQVRALAEASRDLRSLGLDPHPEVMVPLVGAVQELEAVREEVTAILADVGVGAPIGTMIEVPRAAVTAGQIAGAADFFSFGTNDLTQMSWGFSRDDVEASFFARYLDLGIFGVSPFESIDVDGVGRLVHLATVEGRQAQPQLKVGVCGEHGGDPDSIRFFHAVGLDYVSCSPFRVPIARLEAGRAALVQHDPAGPAVPPPARPASGLPLLPLSTTR